MSSQYRRLYGKWDEADNPEVAFDKVRNGEWDKERFLLWTRPL